MNQTHHSDLPVTRSTHQCTTTGLRVRFLTSQLGDICIVFLYLATKKPLRLLNTVYIHMLLKENISRCHQCRVTWERFLLWIVSNTIHILPSWLVKKQTRSPVVVRRCVLHVTGKSERWVWFILCLFFPSNFSRSHKQSACYPAHTHVNLSNIYTTHIGRLCDT